MASPSPSRQTWRSTPRRSPRASTPDMTQKSRRSANQLRKGMVSMTGSPLSLTTQSLSNPSTPSTALGSHRSSSSGSLRSFDFGTESLGKSVNLAMGYADQHYIDEAERMLSGGPQDKQALEAMQNEPDFLEAMARQGVDVSDLREDSGISRERCVVLLGAVMQDKAMHENSLSSGVGCSANIYRDQVHRKSAENLQRVKRNWGRRHQVAQNQAQLNLEVRTHSKERGSSEQARSDRLKARECADLTARKEKASCKQQAWCNKVDQGASRLSARVASCEALVKEQDDRFSRQLQAKAVAVERGRAHSEDNTKMWRERVAQGAHRLADHIAERQAFLQEQDDRFAKRQQQLQNEEDEARERLRSRFILVQQGVECSHKESEARAQRLHQSLERRLRRSGDHQEALRQDIEKERQIQEQKRQDREHQRDRMARVKEYQRSVKAESINDDREIFGDARRLQERMHVELMRKRG